MNDSRLSPQLPADAARYLAAMRRMEAPNDLVDNVMAEVEATPQVRTIPTVQAVSSVLLVAAAALLAIAFLLRIGTPNVGPSPTPVPLDELPSAGSVKARISVEADDVPAAFGHGFLWLTNAATGELVRMNPANGSIVTPLQITEPDEGIPIAITESSVIVADRTGSTLIELDPASREERRRIPVDVTVSAMAPDGSGGLWLLDDDAGTVVRIELADGAVSATVPIDGRALLFHGGAVWVSDAAAGLVRIDPDSASEAGRVAIGFVASQLVGSGGSIVAVAPGEPVVRVDIGGMAVGARGPSVLAGGAEDGSLWVVTTSGYLARLDPSSLRALRATEIDLEASGTLLIGAGSVWSTGRDPAGDTFLVQYSRDE